MTTCQSIIRRAMRMARVLGAGQQPTGHDAAEGLERLQSLMLDLPGLLKNGVWHDKAIANAYTARAGHRLTVTDPGVVTLPLTLNGRAPHDLAKVQILGSASNAGLWVYSATKGSWANIYGMTLAKESPFGTEDDEGLAAMLAGNIAEEYGETSAVGPRTLALAAQAARSFRSRFKAHDHVHTHPYGCFDDYAAGAGVIDADYIVLDSADGLDFEYADNAVLTGL